MSADIEALFGPDTAFVRRYGTETVLRAGRPLLWQDDPAERCALILDGRILPRKHRFGAADLVLPALGPSSWIALAEAVSGVPARADYTADRDTLCLTFTAWNLKAIRERPGVERVLLHALARDVLDLHDALAEGGTLERIISALFARRRVVAGIESSAVAVTQAVLADQLGLTRETVNKRLSELETRGLVHTGRGRIDIPDWKALGDVLHE